MPLATQEACQLCGELEPRRARKLISVCDCNKKREDEGKMHRECLKAYLETLSRRDEGSSDHRCPVCGQKYRVRMFHRFSLDWDRLCSCRVVNNACELCMLVLTLCATIFAYTLLDMKELETEGGYTAGVLLAVMSIFCLVAVVVAFRTTFNRLQTSASELVVEEV